MGVQFEPNIFLLRLLTEKNTKNDVKLSNFRLFRPSLTPIISHGFPPAFITPIFQDVRGLPCGCGP